MAAVETVAAGGVDEAAGRWVLGSAILASSMAFIDGTALNVALPALQADLKLVGPELLWVVNGYALFLAALILVGGALGDQFGRKRVFMIGIGVFAAMSLACGLAPTGGLLIVARMGQGVGGALMVPGSLALIAASFSPARRGAAIGTWGAFSTLTTIMGPVLGGVLANAGWWRAVFFINLPLAALALAILALRVPPDRVETEAKQPLDIPGAVLATLGLAGLTYGFTEAPTTGWTSPLIIAALGGGALALVAFLLLETRTAHPMLPLTLFRARMFSVTNALTLFLYAALGGALFFLPLNLVQVQGYNAALAGFAGLPFAGLLTLLSRPAGRWADQHGPRLALIVGPAIVGAGFALTAVPGLTGGPSDYWTSYFPGLILLGVGMGITVAPLTTAVMGGVAAERAGAASGVNNAVARTAGVLAVAILGAIALIAFRDALATHTAALPLPPLVRQQLQADAGQLANTPVPPALENAQHEAVALAIRLAFVDTFRIIFLCAAGLSWLSAVLALLLPGGRPQAQAGGLAADA